MMTPHATEQYGQVLRVSVVLASLKGRTEAAQASSSAPKPSDPTVVAAAVTPTPFKKVRREKWDVIDPLLSFFTRPLNEDGCSRHTNAGTHGFVPQTGCRMKAGRLDDPSNRRASSGLRARGSS